MKELTKYSRLAGYLEKLYDKLNQDFFNNELERPVITLYSSSTSYGHYTLNSVWDIKGDKRREINVSVAYLDRPIEKVVCTLLHEMCHQLANEVLNIGDCSRNGQYHNKHFKQIAEAHGLICTRTDKYGWSNTSGVVSDAVIEWILENDIQEIKLSRQPSFSVIGTGSHTSDGGLTPITTTSKTSHHRKYICPCCGNSVRATKQVNIICGDCMQIMIEA